MFHRQRPHLIPPLPVFTLAPAGGVTVVILAAEQLRRYDSPGRLVLVGGVFFLGRRERRRERRRESVR